MTKPNLAPDYSFLDSYHPVKGYPGPVLHELAKTGMLVIKYGPKPWQIHHTRKAGAKFDIKKHLVDQRAGRLFTTEEGVAKLKELMGVRNL